MTRAAVRVDAHVGVDVAAAIIDRRRGVVAIGIPRAACAVAPVVSTVIRSSACPPGRNVRRGIVTIV